MKNLLLLAYVILATLSLTSCGNEPETDARKIADSTNTSRIDSAKSADTSSASKPAMADLKQDAEFAVAAADGGMLEVALGKLAVKNGANPAVKKFGKQMVADHSKANMELKTLATEKQIAIPAEMSEKCQKEISDLEAKKGKDFDKAYADLMVTDHKDDIDEFKKEAEKGSDVQISNWAKNTLPTLEHHLMMAEEMQKSVDK
jgi:putative membrane protein